MEVAIGIYLTSRKFAIRRRMTVVRERVVRWESRRIGCAFTGISAVGTFGRSIHLYVGQTINPLLCNENPDHTPELYVSNEKHEKKNTKDRVGILTRLSSMVRDVCEPAFQSLIKR